MPTSTKPTSGFHICDILELNKEKQQKEQDQSLQDDEEKSKVDENCDDEELELKRENLSCESDENQNENSIKRKHSPSPASPTIRRESSSPVDDLKKMKKQSKLNEERHIEADRHQLLSETIHQYPHLFQNHPAMRPWFNPTRKFPLEHETH